MQSRSWTGIWFFMLLLGSFPGITVASSPERFQPTPTRYEMVLLPQDVERISKFDEVNAIDMYKKIIEMSRAEKDETTEQLFKNILMEEEDHHDVFSTLLEEI